MPREVSNCPHFTVIDETADYIVVNKPAPLLIHPAKPDHPYTLWDGLRDLLAYELVNGAQLSIINRLDRETSGLVLVAKNVKTARIFHKAMKRRETRKEYLAIVWGWPKDDEFVVEAPLLKRSDIEDSPIWIMQMVHPQGAASLTKFRVEKRFERQTSNGLRFSLIRAFPHTGRMHQIRLHLHHAGFPVVGDKIYGIDPLLYLDHIRDGWTPELEAKLLIYRHALHSCAMTVAFEGRERRWDAPLEAHLHFFVEEPCQPLPKEEPFQMHLPAMHCVRWRDFSPGGGNGIAPGSAG